MSASRVIKVTQGIYGDYLGDIALDEVGIQC